MGPQMEEMAERHGMTAALVEAVGLRARRAGRPHGAGHPAETRRRGGGGCRPGTTGRAGEDAGGGDIDGDGPCCECRPVTKWVNDRDSR